MSMQVLGWRVQRVPASPGPLEHEGGLDLQQVRADRPVRDYLVSPYTLSFFKKCNWFKATVYEKSPAGGRGGVIRSKVLQCPKKSPNLELFLNVLGMQLT